MINCTWCGKKLDEKKHVLWGAIYPFRPRQATEPFCSKACYDKQNEVKKGISSVCEQNGCMQQKHFEAIRELQATIARQEALILENEEIIEQLMDELEDNDNE